MRRAIVLLLTAALAACGGDEPSGGRPSPSVSPTSVGNLREGSAKVTLGGGVSGSVDLTLNERDSQLHPEPGGFALFWTKGRNLLTIGGATFDGTKKTSGALVLGFAYDRAGALVSHTSSDGGCTVTMKTDGKTVQGTFRCASLETGEGAAYTAEGTFSAR